MDLQGSSTDDAEIVRILRAEGYTSGLALVDALMAKGKDGLFIWVWRC